MSDSAAPGWYHAEGDPPNTERYWDGAAWTEGPRPIGGASSPVAEASDPTPSEDSPGSNMPVMGAADTEISGMGSDAPGGFSSVTPGPSDVPGTDLPGAAPGGFSSVTPTPDTAAPGSFTPPVAQPPAFGNQPPVGGMPVGGMPAGGVPGQFPGAPPAGVYGNAYPEASQATMALVLSIVGALACCVTAPIGAYFGYVEKNAIDAGRRDPSNRGQAMGALIVGAIVTVLYILAFLFILVIGFAGA